MWRYLLVGGLALNAVTGFGYRVYRLTKGGPMPDVWGQAVLGVFLALLAVLIGFGADWARWLALAYAAIYAFVGMPVWILGVLLPLPPRAIDYAYAVVYSAVLIVIAVAAIAL